MHHLTRTSQPQRKRELILALLCVVLVIFAGLVQLTHSHGSGTLSHPDCALCVSAHTTVSPSTPVTLPAPLTHIARVEIAAPTRAPRSLFKYSFRIRPPPVVPASI
jgi:hypothetical protein